jgi:hypothetical protein
MARGKKSTKADTLTENDRKAIRTLLRKAGSHDEYIRWGKEEWAQLLLAEDFDNFVLSQVADWEKNVRKYQDKSVLKQKGIRPLTRENIISQFVHAAYRKDLGASEYAVAKRIARKARDKVRNKIRS